MRMIIRKGLIIAGLTLLMALLPQVVLAQQNILTNGSFETGSTSGWVYKNLNGATSGVTAETAAHGTYSYKIIHDPNDPESFAYGLDWSCIGQNVNGIIEPGRLYKYRFAYKTSYAHDLGWDVRLALADSGLLSHSNTIISLAPVAEPYYSYGSTTYYVAPLVADGQWHYVEARVTRTASELSYEPSLAFYYDYGTPGTIYVDDFQVTPVETIAPSTTISLSGTQGQNGWFISDVQVTLTAIDNFGGSGVAKTEFSFDGSAWHQYNGPFTILEAGETDVYYRSIDNDGNVEPTKGPEKVKIDYSAPEELSLSLCGELGDNGWFKSDVKGCVSATDTVSGVLKKEYSFDQATWYEFVLPFTISDEGTTTVYYRATDNAGNTSAIKEHDMKIDKTAPTTTITLDGTLGNNGWYVSDVTVTLSATDTISGVARTEYSFDGASWTLYNTPFIISNEGTTTVYYRSIDNAGNIEGSVGNPDVPKEEPVKSDPIPPVTPDPILPPPPGDGGYYPEPPELTFPPVPDGPSGPGYIEYSWDCSEWFRYHEPILITEDGVKICYYRAVDGAGNKGELKYVIIKIDKTDPITQLSLDGTLGNNGWYISDVTVTLEATDTVSGVDYTEYSFDNATWHRYSEPFVVSAEGTTTVYYRSVDIAGNVEDTKGPAAIRIAKIAPVVMITTPADNAQYLINQVILADWTVEGYVAGLFSVVATAPNGGPIDTATPGTKTFTVTATDMAGHVTTKTHTYTVGYDYFGVLQPINSDGSSIFRQGKGRVIPVKFQLKDANGGYVSTAIAALYYAKVLNDVTGTVTAANTVGEANTDNLFRYDSVDNLYIYNLDTNALSSGTWELQIVLDDGMTKTVRISIK